MDGTTFANIQSAVLRELGEGAISLANDIERYRKITVKEIASYYQWSWLENVPITMTTDSGQSYITIPSYFGGEITIHQNSSGREIRYMSPQAYAKKLGESTNTTDKPDWYTVRGGRLEFYMPLTTGTSVIVFGTIDSTQYDDDSTNSINGIAKKIPNIFEYVIEAGILEKIEPDMVKKANWSGTYNKKLKDQISRDGISKGRTVATTKDRAILNSRSYLRG